jgi:hypothetical protein
VRLLAATTPGEPARPNEDWFLATPALIVVVDGATARMDTGCSHGVAWFAEQLGEATAFAAAADPTTDLALVLAEAISHVASLHGNCDLRHPGTPSANIGVARRGVDRLAYLVLGDVTVVVEDEHDRVLVVSDHRVSLTAAEEREAADRLPIGSAAKQDALRRMKVAELEARNRPGGYWCAETDPAAAAHALTGSVPLTSIRRIAVMSDGAARATDLFGLMSWPEALAELSTNGPDALIAQVRAAEGSDPLGLVWPRNKCSDDATAVYQGP